MTHEIETDVAIIGAGPVGTVRRVRAGDAQASRVLVDALAEVGGQCTALYPEKPIYDIPAHPAIEAGELVGAAGAADRAVRARRGCWGGG